MVVRQQRDSLNNFFSVSELTMSCRAISFLAAMPFHLKGEEKFVSQEGSEREVEDVSPRRIVCPSHFHQGLVICFPPPQERLGQL